MTIQEKAKAWFGEFKVWEEDAEGPWWRSELNLDCFQPSDKEALMQLTGSGDVYAICALLVGMKRKEHSWMEEFEDEETGEKVSVLRYEIIDGTTFEAKESEKKQLLQKLVEIKGNIDDETLSRAAWYVKSNAGLDATPLYLELVSRRKEDAASSIEDPVLLQQLCDAGNRYAADQLYEKYRWGDEANGIFINRKQARHYYDLAGDIPYKEEWDDSDDPGEPNPSTYEYTLTGNAAILGTIHTMLYDLCKKYGIPENEEDGLGLFIPQRQLMKLLVGSDTEFYRGNIQHIEQPTTDCLILTTEADRGEPLLYALRQCFENIDIKMKEGEL